MIETEFTFGANILENLTTGMYRNPLVLYREYIQNACDSIDKAISANLLTDTTQGKIEIWLDAAKRNIEIKDNGMGIPSADFRRVLGNIADSDKTLGEDKGFRGIGRLCGLAYCKKLTFYSKYKGEDTVSILVCDAEKMRRLLSEHQSKKQKYLASEILSQIYDFSQESNSDINTHYFRVVLTDVDVQNNNLINTSQVKEYLSFVAPVPYQNTFFYSKNIYDKAKEIGVPIDEYSIKVDGELIFKKYVTILKDKNGAKYDDVADVAFKKIYDRSGCLIAWMWVGVFQFKNAIPKNNIMRGIRLRKENIQIGDEDALQKLFKEDRGNSYFVGEVFALDSDLIPNSQRDYFNQNQAREEFEASLKQYFDDELQKTYYFGSAQNSGYKKIEKYESLKEEFTTADSTGSFAGAEHKAKKKEQLFAAEEEAKKAQIEIQKRLEKTQPDSLLWQVAKLIQNNRERVADSKESVAETDRIEKSENTENKRSKNWRVDKLSRLNKQERKLVGRIFDIIFTIVDKDTAEKIVSKIEETLK